GGVPPPRIDAPSRELKQPWAMCHTACPEGPPPESSCFHLRQRRLRLRQPEDHVHRTVHLNSRRERNTGLLPLAGGGIQRAQAPVAARYHFIHDLYQEVLYERVPASRRMRWHRQIGMRLEAGYGPRVQEIAAELAMHFARGRDAPRAVVYLHQAADNALRRYANREAISHLSQALAELKTLPHSHESLQHELALLIALGPALVAIKGYGAVDVEHTYTRAREICQQLGDALQLSQVLWGL